MTPITDAKLREILDGCEGVTPGPWEVDSEPNDSGSEKYTSYAVFADIAGTPRTIVDTFNSDASEVQVDGDCDGVSVWDEQGRKNTAYIASLSPEVVASIISELIAAREALKHLGNVLLMLADLHPDEQCRAFTKARDYYNAARPEAEVLPTEGYVSRIVTEGPLDRALGEAK